MEEIEVNIKLSKNNKIYYMLIRKSDTILRLKEYCQKISDIPPSEQNLLYKGKILIDEKLIGDYNIENNQTIILLKKEEPKLEYVPIAQKLSSLNNKNLLDNKDINYKEDAKSFTQLPDKSSFFKNVDMKKINNYLQSLGFETISELCEIKPQEWEEFLKDPSFMESLKNLFNDPSSLENFLKDPYFQEVIQKSPLNKFICLNPQIVTPQNFQKVKNVFYKNEKNIIESSKTEISVPPDPFGSLDNNQINQMMNSSGKITNINSFNKNNTPNKEIIGNIGIDIDYKEKYKDQLSQLNDMGFIDEESNIQALKQCNGDINNTLEKLLK